MSRAMKPRILAFCTLAATVLSGTMLSGQVPEKQKKAARRATPSMARTQDPGPTPEPKLPFPTKPGSPEAIRLAAFMARVEKGEVPIARFGQPPREDFRMGQWMPAFVRTEIVPQKVARGEMLAFQHKLSPAFAENDPIPASRNAHFAWLKAHPNVRIFGWYGTVVGAEVQADSSMIVAIEFHPKTEITGQRAIVRDFVTEKYRVADGRLHLIDTDAGINNPAIQVISSF